MTRTLFQGEVHVHYGQVYVESGEGGCDLHECFAGQVNGLCGAAVPGTLFLITGLHTGHVALTVSAHEEPPPVEEAWEDVVEVSFTPESPRIALVQWAGEASWDLDLAETTYRVRYSAAGMDAARDADTRLDEEPLLDRYLLQFWPAPPGPDRILRQGSEDAAYWHGFAAGLPPPPPPPTPEELAEAERRRRAERERREEERRRAAELRAWDGRLPSAALRAVTGNGRAMARLDRDLAEAIAAAGPETQRSIARWTARRAYTDAGLAGLDWAAAALDALDAGDEPPPPFHDHRQVWDTFFSDPRVPRSTVTSLQGDADNVLMQAMAVPAVFGATRPEPLEAALESLWAAATTYGHDGHRAFFREVREAFGL